MDLTILRFDSIGSTNTEAIEQAKKGADEGLCIVAQEQTAGRGRQGRAWASGKDAGLYFSIVLRPRIDNRFVPLITLMTAVAVYDVLRDIGLEPDIKWPNDLHINEKKICGILAEVAETPKGRAIIVGTGINLNSSNYPPEIVDTATSIEEETGAPADREQILTLLTRSLSVYCDILYNPNGPAAVRDAWAKRSSYHSGKEVRVTLPGSTLTGVTRGIAEDGALIIETPGGSCETIHAGDVEKLRSAAR